MNENDTQQLIPAPGAARPKARSKTNKIPRPPRRPNNSGVSLWDTAASWPPPQGFRAPDLLELPKPVPLEPEKPLLEASNADPNNPREAFQRYFVLRIQRDAVEAEMRRCLEVLRYSPRSDRPYWHCRRCGHDWRGFWNRRPPCGCPRCHSTRWMADPVLPTARTPEDPPNPKWYQPRRTHNRMATPKDTVPIPLPTAVRQGIDPPPKLKDVMRLVAEEAARFADDYPAPAKSDGTNNVTGPGASREGGPDDSE